MLDELGRSGRTEMREIAAFAVAALILIGVGSLGRDIPTVKEAAAATEAGLILPEVPIASCGIDPFDLMANAKDLPVENWQFRAPVAK
jgi:hypothetical protein